ncbi:MAG: thymidine phosphorylase [Christensenellaceae bacterium]|jgi:pyrimidine-nucleoside phosphorylase|nr:thymidine phosphorylase [Christensenellaceae bacterium]MBS6564330.1 thymidine phosphorylase [Clostridiales bacterium]PWL99132.1 MAG: thymidine phosphorylase [Selenomonadales bacterium]
MITELLRKKRDGLALNQAEIDEFISGCLSGEAADYQISAMLMAIYLNGMTEEETFNLTRAMTASGDICDLSEIKGVKMDKHSSGGVSDGVTLILAPMLAACGAVVAKMSGRGLGHTGGTVDKLESIPNMCLEIREERFKEILRENGLCVTGQSENMAPADKLLYALRDVTATVESIPLIASSIMSKKLAAGADCIMLDVKCGSGAFMKEPAAAGELARLMVKIGRRAGKRVQAAITDMNRPLGRAIGNSLEIMEAVRILKGEEKGPLLEVALLLGCRLLIMGEMANSETEAREKLEKSLLSGEAFSRFERMVWAQGGDARALSRFDMLPVSREYEYKAEKSGFINEMDAQALGSAALALGAGREKKGESIDYGAGIYLIKTLRERVEKGEPIARVYTQKSDWSQAGLQLGRAFGIGEERPAPPLIYEIIE